MKKAVLAKLIAVAQAKALTTYTEIGKAADLDVANGAALDALVRILDEIAMDDIKARRPLLASVVVRADTQMPSKGLFKFAKKHGVMRGSDEVGFWSTELKRVYDSAAARES